MKFDELIEQLEMIIRDHPEAAHLDVRVSDEDVFAVNLKREEGSFRGEDYVENFVEIELWRPYALDKEDK
jgi:hypothetical protein